MDFTRPLQWVDAQKALDGDYPDGRLCHWKSMYLRDLSDEMIERLAGHAAQRPSPLTLLDIRALGGAFSRIDPDTTPFVFRTSPFIFNIESNWEDPARNTAHE